MNNEKTEIKVKLSGNEHVKGHLATMFTIFIWGTTFISTKVLLVFLSPLEILLFRFAVGWVVLFILKPTLLKPGFPGHITRKKVKH